MSEILDNPTPAVALEAIQAELTRSVYISVPHSEVLAIASGYAHDSAVLMDGDPGLGKTYMAKKLAHIVGGSFGRVQGTEDLQSSDITGSQVYNLATKQMEFQPGPIFKDVVLIDDWTRARRRELSGLIEAMAENQVTVGNETHSTPENQLIIATQNAEELKEGTTAAPKANRDRFGLSISVPALTSDALKRIRILKGYETRQRVDINQVAPRIREEAAHVVMPDELDDRAGLLLEAMRVHSDIDQSATYLGGYRAYDQLINFASTRAIMHGREMMHPDDLHTMGRFVLAHRVVIDYDAQDRSIPATFETVYQDVLSKLPEIDMSNYRSKEAANA